MPSPESDLSRGPLVDCPCEMPMSDPNPGCPKHGRRGSECITHHACDCHLRMAEALRRIAGMPLEPRPDGTHNYSRSALIQIASDALEAGRPCLNR